MKNNGNFILAENTGRTVEEISRDTERDNFMTAGEAFLLYSIYDGTENKQEVVKQVEEHVERFAKRFQKMPDLR